MTALILLSGSEKSSHIIPTTQRERLNFFRCALARLVEGVGGKEKKKHEHLKAKRKTALRLGHLSNEKPWTIKPEKIDLMLKGKLKFEDLTGQDVMPNVRQKGVDMRIAVDISSLAMKHQVNQIVLMAGDADFVPAAKMARREGIDFIVDPMWGRILPNLLEHIDGLRSTCPKPKPNPVSAEVL